jgi:hypothetical protein
MLQPVRVGIIARQRIELRPDEVGELRRRVRVSAVSARERRRSQSSAGLTQWIADRIGISRLQVNRLAANALAGWNDAPGRGRKPRLAEGAAQSALFSRVRSLFSHPLTSRIVATSDC